MTDSKTDAGGDREHIAAILYITRFPHRTWIAASLDETALAYKQADMIIALRTPARCDGEALTYDCPCGRGDKPCPGPDGKPLCIAPVSRCDADTARAAVIEECAKLCDGLRRKDYSAENADWTAGTLDCATAIRALATPAVKREPGAYLNDGTRINPKPIFPFCGLQEDYETPAVKP